jgi:hypothetical protein
VSERAGGVLGVCWGVLGCGWVAWGWGMGLLCEAVGWARRGWLGLGLLCEAVGWARRGWLGLGRAGAARRDAAGPPARASLLRQPPAAPC